VTGEVAAAVVSGVQVECGARRMRYFYHEGYDENGAQIYRFDVPSNVAWNSGDRVSDQIDALCREPAADGLSDFDSVEAFLARIGPPPTFVPSVVRSTP
jgi:hypothetical protein